MNGKAHVKVIICICVLAAAAAIACVVRQEVERMKESIREAAVEAGREAGKEVRAGIVEGTDRAVDRTMDRIGEMPGKAMRDITSQVRQAIVRDSGQSEDTASDPSGNMVEDVLDILAAFSRQGNSVPESSPEPSLNLPAARHELPGGELLGQLVPASPTGGVPQLPGLGGGEPPQDVRELRRGVDRLVDNLFEELPIRIPHGAPNRDRDLSATGPTEF